MIDAWDIYWVLQLDAINTAAITLTVLGAAAVFIAWLAHFDPGTRLSIAVPMVLTPAWMLVFALAVFLPSTKTAAAMFVIPAIANNEAIQNEAGELYDLAKDALRQAAQPDKAPAK